MSEPVRVDSVLVVEDDARVRRTIGWTLEAEGLAVDLAPNGTAALAHSRRRRPGLVVLDILPDIDGYAVAERIRADHGPDVPFLVITAGGGARDKVERVGAFDYLDKPFELDDLAATVKRGLAR